MINDNELHIFTRNSEDFIQQVLQAASEGYEYVEGSARIRSAGKRATFLKTSSETPETSLESEVVQTPTEDSESSSATSETPSSVSEEVVKESPKDPMPDWDLIKSFESASDQKGSKDKLANYAKEEFDVVLKKNVNFKKMLEIFQTTIK